MLEEPEQQRTGNPIEEEQQILSPNRSGSRIPRLSFQGKSPAMNPNPMFSVPQTIPDEDDSRSPLPMSPSMQYAFNQYNMQGGSVSPPGQSFNDGSYEPSTIDRVNTPGKLRAFFDEVKKSRSAGDNVSVPQKYKDMLAEDRVKAKKTPDIHTSHSFGGLAPIASSNNASPMQRRSTMAQGVRPDYDGTGIAEAHTIDVGTLSGGMRRKSYNPKAVIPKIESANTEMWTDTKYEPITSPTGSLKKSPSRIPRQDHSPPESQANENSIRSPVVRKNSTLKPSQPQKNVQFTEDEEMAVEEEEAPIPIQSPPPKPKPVAKSPVPEVKKTEAEPKPDPMDVDKKAKSPEPEKEEEAEEEEERPPTPEGMTRCEFCERCFNDDRIEKHNGVCQKNPEKKQRKVFDGKTIRTKGTEFESFKGKKTSSTPKAPKKADWRKEHETFINSIRAAKGP